MNRHNQFRSRSLTMESLEPRMTPSVLGATDYVAAVSPSCFEAVYSAPSQVASAGIQVSSSPEFTDMLDEIRTSYAVPGMVAAAMVDGQVTVAGASGVRVQGKAATVTLSDQFALGSETKAMTATLAGVLVDRHRINWSTTIAQVFPEFRSLIQPAYRNVTLEQLLAHRSGLRDLPEEPLLSIIEQVKLPPMAARRVFLLPLLRQAPVAETGAFHYSNSGYAVAAAMLERVTGCGYENLMRHYVFTPLGLKSAGFGSPNCRGAVPQQPGGHDENGNPVGCRPDVGVPAILNPAGGIHMNVRDWLTFLQCQLGEPVRGQRLLKPATLERLHTPYPATDVLYALGWGVIETPNGHVLYHDGSDGNWYASMILIPGLKTAIVVAANRGETNGAEACADVTAVLTTMIADQSPADATSAAQPAAATLVRGHFFPDNRGVWLGESFWRLGMRAHRNPFHVWSSPTASW